MSRKITIGLTLQFDNEDVVYGGWKLEAKSKCKDIWELLKSIFQAGICIVRKDCFA